MDSGLGSDEEQRRSRTKEQKQRHNEQLLNGAHCFIDASTLQDDDETSTSTTDMMEQRRTEERRQGALLFQSAIPQYSTMLQLAPGSSEMPPETPHNSIVQISNDTFADDPDMEVDVSTKPSLGFYVDLNQVEIDSPALDTCTSAKKNIFSMVIDFEAPKKDMPVRLLRNACRRKTGPKQMESINQDSKLEATPLVENLSLAECVNTVSDGTLKEVNRISTNNENFVRLSDLIEQNPKAESELCNEIVGPRMSRSIPESSWVENPLLMSRSAGFRIAPRPLEPDGNSLIGSTGSQTGASQRRLGTDLLRMFLEELDTDTVLLVGTPPRTIKAHRCILISRCQYFAGTLRGHSLTIEGFSYDAVQFALCHIYSGAAHVPDSISLVELASLADMLSLEGLKEVVAHALKSRHCHNFHSPCAGCLTGVLEVLPLSSAYGLDELYQRCLKWIKANYLRVWPSRAFASLNKELREKCYQQLIVHMNAASVLNSTLSCDRLLASLPTLKWAEPVVQLALQLANSCQTYIHQHFAAVVPSLLKTEPWNIPRIEEVLFNAANGLNPDQECHIYSRCCNILEKHKEEMNQTLQELFEKLCSLFEKRLVTKVHKLAKCPNWMKLEPHLRVHIKNLVKLEDTSSKSTRSEPSRLPRMISNKPNTSSSESSRNSSPATSQTHPSPSLRRSLLLAARAPQVPPSPATNRRVSTLTLPTQASAAKSAPARHLKQNPSAAITVTNVNKNRPISAPVVKNSTGNKIGAGNSSGKESSLNKKKSDKHPKCPNVGFSRRPNSLQTQPLKKINNNEKLGTGNKKAAVAKSQSMQRSTTFLKEEPTVLTHSSQNL